MSVITTFGFFHLLRKEYKDISPLLNETFDFDPDVNKYHLPPNRRFNTRIDVRLRIKYFLLSYMRRMDHQHYFPTFDEIIMTIMPLLKNGITPEQQTILGVLQEVAVRTVDGRWRLAEHQQLTLL